MLGQVPSGCARGLEGNWGAWDFLAYSKWAGYPGTSTRQSYFLVCPDSCLLLRIGEMFATARMIKLFYFLVFLCSAGDASLLRAVPTTAHPSKVATEERVWYLLPNGTMQHDKVKSLMCMLLHLAQPYYSCLRHSSSYISISMTRAAMYVLETLIHRCFSFLWLAVLTSSCMGTFSIN